MGTGSVFGVGSLILLLQSMPVNFKIDGVPPPAENQVPLPLAAPDTLGIGSPAPRPVAQWHAPDAIGFGQNVPLAFAIRQITPRWVNVSYCDGVNSQQPVSWRGGRPWNQVLGDVLTPLGLHMKMSGRALRIEN
jgi:hypothetical protein